MYSNQINHSEFKIDKIKKDQKAPTEIKIAYGRLVLIISSSITSLILLAVVGLWLSRYWMTTRYRVQDEEPVEFESFPIDPNSDSDGNDPDPNCEERQNLIAENEFYNNEDSIGDLSSIQGG